MKNIKISIILFILLMAVFMLLAGRCFYLQYFNNEYYTEISKKQHQGRYIYKPKRGTILDCRSRVIAASSRIHTIFAEPRAIEDPKEVSNQLQHILDRPAHKICMKIVDSKNPGYVKIKTPATESEIKKALKYQGIGVESNWQRHYPLKALTCHVTGFTSTDNKGLEGIELLFDTELKGNLGTNLFLADAFRRPIRANAISRELDDGQSLILTIDATIQQFARDELKKRYDKYQAEAGIAIVAHVKTGAVLAMVSLPDFNPEQARNTNPDYFRNRAITDQFEPGSILKPIATAIALDAGVINYNDTIFCENGNYHGKGFGQIGEYNYHKYGNLKIREIIVKSSNIGMAKIGQKLGKHKLHKGLNLFGFGKITGIDLPGEVSGQLRDVDVWDGYSITRVPFGHELTATAIQMVKAYCILANEGRYIKPYIVKAIIDSEGQITTLKQPIPPIGYIIKPEVAKWIVTNPLVGVINDKKNGGTGWRAKLEKWQVFGKTGTANIAKKGEKGYSEDYYVASFIAGAPAEDPEIIVLVSIRKPNKKLGLGYTGGAVASPAVGKIIEKTLTYLDKNPL